MFELQVISPVPGLEALGERVELRELAYRDVRAALAAGSEVARSTEALFAASLHVDGAPLGLDALDALPGRLAGSVTRALQRCLALHGMGAPAGGEAAGEASGETTGEGPAAGEP
jgi:hypothetical protein